MLTATLQPLLQSRAVIISPEEAVLQVKEKLDHHNSY